MRGVRACAPLPVEGERLSGGGGRLYFVVSQPGTRVARLLGLFTRARRNHVSLLLEIGAEEMYSFGRKVRWFPLRGGFVVERLSEGVLRLCAARSPFDLVEVRLTETQREAVRVRLGRFLAAPERYAYNLLGLLPQLFGFVWVRKRHFSCSQFCAFLVEGILPLPKRYPAMLPEDFYKLGRVVRSGRLSELLTKEFLI